MLTMVEYLWKSSSFRDFPESKEVLYLDKYAELL